MEKIISDEDKQILKNCWVMTTDHTLDEENIKLKQAIQNVLENTMTSREKSEWGYEYFIKHKQYKDDLEYNKQLLRKWAQVLKGNGNANYDYAYAIERVLRELESYRHKCRRHTGTKLKNLLVLNKNRKKVRILKSNKQTQYNKPFRR